MPGRVLRLYEETLGEVLTGPLPQEGLFLTDDASLPGGHCYVTPMAPELWSALPVLRPGWWVASLRHNKIYPDHALAMTLGPADVTEHIDLSPDDPRLSRYLDGSVWPGKGSAGFLLVTVDGFPLGWAKRAEGRVRSRYPVHLRRRRAL